MAPSKSHVDTTKLCRCTQPIDLGKRGKSSICPIDTTLPIGSAGRQDLSLKFTVRQPTETTGRLAQVRWMRLSRRDAGDLMLMAASRADAERQALDPTGRILAAVAQAHPDLVTELLPAASWACSSAARNSLYTAPNPLCHNHSSSQSRFATYRRRSAGSFPPPSLHRRFGVPARALDGAGAVAARIPTTTWVVLSCMRWDDASGPTSGDSCAVRESAPSDLLSDPGRWWRWPEPVP